MSKIFTQCESCGQPLLPYQARQGDSHKKCFDLSHTCQNCDEEILPGKGFVTDDGEGYHYTCLVFSPTSSCELCHCSIPASKLKEVGSKKYHKDCHTKNFFCAECKEAVIPGERQFDRNGVAYHLSCFAEKETLRNNLRQIEEAGGRLSKMFPKSGEEEVLDTAARAERAILIGLKKCRGILPAELLFPELFKVTVLAGTR